ncbi:Gtb1 protein [Saccharomycopsis crataegensis]|uniref:Glucosidase 2 subunit beta n=1 Tax=Saccharomycopsis crataegensis TaxID=43959 RepID=A0AAV5QDE2_9ASCO|nr:Gtb1 protein [Saccharomycopsis crataegensis]
MKVSVVSVLVAVLTNLASAESVRGVAPNKQHLYKADSNGKWKCLSNPEIEIDFSKVNDDYCDCPDGSDEPGTSACESGKFFCENAGYKPSYIPSYKVNDGVCDYEICCDGSDEWNTDAKCKNVCKELNEKYESLKKERLSKLTKGLKIKQQMLAQVAKADEELDTKIQKESMEVSQLNDEVYQLKKKIEALNTKYNKEAMEFIAELKGEHSASTIDEKIYSLKEAIHLIKLGVDKNIEKSEISKEILLNLATDFDQNINDVTVKKAIEDFQEFSNDKKFDEFDTLYKEYLEKYNAMLGDLDLYNIFFLLEKNKVHMANWKNFIWTRKSSLHSTLLKLLLIQDESSKKLEAIMTDIKENYNPNFNNKAVKTALKGIESYETLKQKVQDDVLGKIDYANDYDGAVKGLMTFIEELEAALGRPKSEAKDLQIADDLSTEELEAKQSEKKLQMELEAEEEEARRSTFPQNIKQAVVRAVEDFLGVYDNLPEEKETVFETVPYDLVSRHLSEINDLSNAGDEDADSYSKELTSLQEEMRGKQELIQELNQQVGDLVQELNDSTNYYGPSKVLKAVENQSFKASIGEYEYEIDFVGNIKQSGNGQSAHVGTYSGDIKKLVNPKDGTTKLEMAFKNGAKCWSGPIRQAKVTVYCGESVEILKVTEPEVCQYYIDVTSPIACFESELEQVEEKKLVESESVHDEL